jgi:long-chain acyl-CoA synthetase
MPHIFERVMSFYTVQNGGKIGMYSGDKKILFEDAQILKPTIFYSVPRIFNKIYGNVMK